MARYLTSSGQFARAGSKTKRDAFLPNPAGKLSVFRIVGLDDAAIWDIARRHIAARDRPVYGRSEIKAGAVLPTGLTIDPDNAPVRHANIVGWPAEKSARRLLAQELSKGAVLRLADDAIVAP